MSSIRSILEIIVPRVGEIDGLTEELREKCIETALKEIEEAIKKEVIGEDEKDEAGWNEQIRNGLRAEQRNNLKELLK